MSNKILAVAINEYDDTVLNNLNNCKSDVESILKILTTKYKFDDIEFIFEKVDTSRKALFNKLKFYFANCMEDENILLYFSGHGQYDESLNTTYWQPSDAEYTDSSTWFNLNDLMTFIKISKAHHISIISDSCFSGAMFQEPMRGGGIEALNKKKSRIGFASGSIEPVSDGPKGKLSPFAKSLIDELKTNNINYCPLSTIATNVIVNFDIEKKQTPTFAPLSNVGHEGGIFILELKESTNTENQNIEYLKNKYSNIFIPIVEEHSIEFENLELISEKKMNAVKKQEYLDARKFKDEEDNIRKKFSDTFISNFIKVTKDIHISDQTSKIVNRLDKKLIKFEEDLPKLKKNLKEALIKLQKEHKEISIGQKLFNLENEDEIIETIIQNQTAEKDYIKYFEDYKDELLKKYNSNIVDLYTFFKSIQGNSKSKFLNKKEGELIDIISDIYDSEINFLISSSIDDVDFLIKIGETELRLLNWIKNKEK